MENKIVRKNELVKLAELQKEYIDSRTSSSGGEVTLPDYIEADKLKTPVTIWGQEFDGSKNIGGKINGLLQVESRGGDIGLGIYSYSGGPNGYYINLKPIDTNRIDFSSYGTPSDIKVSIGGGLSNRTLYVRGDIEASDNIISPNITAIESKLEGVTKVADDSKVLKDFDIALPDCDITIEKGRLTSFGLEHGNGIIITGRSGLNNGIFDIATVSANTDYLATREYVDDKINFLVNSEGELEDSFDTLKEVDTWIKEHESEAADIISRQNAIEEWKGKIDKLSLLYIEV